MFPFHKINMIKKILGKILELLSKIEPLYVASRKIVDYHQNENNCEIESNGELNFIKHHKKDFTVIFDVGANIGEWTNLTCKLIPEARVYSFEPSHGTFATLLKNTKDNKNAHIFNIGLGDKTEQKEFFEYGENSVLSSAIKRDDEIGQAKTTVASFETVDDFCKRNAIPNISFLKIDTEGNELAVLNGAKDMLTFGNIDAVQFEYGGTYIDGRILLKDIFEFFKGKPYRIFKLKQNGLMLCEGYSEILENFQYSNYIAIKKII